MISGPTEEQLRRFAWTSSINDVLTLHEAVTTQLSLLGVSWLEAKPFSSTTEPVGTFNGQGWRRWVLAVTKDTPDDLDKLSRFAATCGLRLGQIEQQGEELLQRLVNGPQETLDVELKPWLMPTEKSDIAKIAKACIALRNNNGGYLLLGFEDDGTPAGSAPTDVSGTYHVDIIQEIVSKYASEPFAVSVEIREREGQRYPIVVVPSGIVTPVFTKSSLTDPVDVKRRLIEDDTIYVRSVTANNRVSSTKLRRSDASRLMKTCFDNREADIGAFIRRHLSGLSPEVLQGALAAVRQSVQPKETAIQFLDEGYGRFVSSLSERGQQVPNLGYMESAAILDKIEHPRVPSRELIHRLQSSMTNHSGWAPWTIIDNPKAQDLNPRVVQGKWEALMDSLDDQLFGGMLDYWQIDPAGRLYYARALEDDLRAQARGVTPHTVLDYYIVIYRVTEVLAAAIQISRGLTEVNDTFVGFAFRWRGLRNRVLGSWSNPGRFLRRQARCHDDVVITDIRVPIDVPDSAIPSHVYQAVRPLFLAFEGYDFAQDVVEKIASSVLQRSM